MQMVPTAFHHFSLTSSEIENPKNKKALRITRRAPAAVSSTAGLVGAAREKGDQHHQIRQRKQPLVCLDPGAFRGPRDETQMTALGKIVDVVDANPGKSGDL